MLKLLYGSRTIITLHEYRDTNITVIIMKHKKNISYLFGNMLRTEINVKRNQLAHQGTSTVSQMSYRLQSVSEISPRSMESYTNRRPPPLQ